MSSPEFVKGACRHCAGHIEFSSANAGQTTACPHCGQPTELIPLAPPYNPRNYRGIWLGLIAALCLIVAVGGYFHVKKASGSAAPALPVPQTNAPVAEVPKPPPSIETNDFSILPFKLEKTAGNSLVYVIGTIRNASERQRFAVKVSFRLLSANDTPAGSATDYRPVLEPHAEWHFKALVIDSKAASAQFNSISEDK